MSYVLTSELTNIIHMLEKGEGEFVVYTQPAMEDLVDMTPIHIEDQYMGSHRFNKLLEALEVDEELEMNYSPLSFLGDVEAGMECHIADLRNIFSEYVDANARIVKDSCNGRLHIDVVYSIDGE